MVDACILVSNDNESHGYRSALLEVISQLLCCIFIVLICCFWCNDRNDSTNFQLCVLNFHCRLGIGC